MSERSVPDNALRRLFSRKPVAYYPELARAVGSVSAAIFLQELCHWERYSEDGWVFRTRDEIEAETALGRRVQESARKVLREAGIITEQHRGNPRRLFYRINYDNLESRVQTHQTYQQAAQNVPASRTERTNSIYTGNYTGEDTDSSKDEDGLPSPGQFVGYLREELDGADVPLLRNREDRYAGEFNKLIKKRISEDVLYKACDRIVERWRGDEHRKLTAEQALEDVLNGKPPKHVSEPARLSAAQRKAGYEWLFEEKDETRDLDAELKRLRESA